MSKRPKNAPPYEGAELKRDQNASRGRPRDVNKRELILETALNIMKTEGYGALSIARVAAQSGVARPTIKLRWADKEKLSIAVVKKLFEERPIADVLDDTNSLSITEKLQAVLVDLANMLSEPGVAKVLSSFIAAANFSEPMSDIRQYILTRRGITLRGLLQEGVRRGEFSSRLDIGRAIDALNGPIMYRILIMGLPMQAADIKFILDSALRTPSG